MRRIASPWFAVHRETHKHHKLLSLKSDTERWFWLRLQCLTDDLGALPVVEQIAYDLGIDVKTTRERMAALVRARLVDRTGAAFAMHDWSEWQPKSASVRAKKWREKKALENKVKTKPNARTNVRKNVRPNAQANVHSNAHANAQTNALDEMRLESEPSLGSGSKSHPSGQRRGSEKPRRRPLAQSENHGQGHSHANQRQRTPDEFREAFERLVLADDHVARQFAFFKSAALPNGFALKPGDAKCVLVESVEAVAELKRRLGKYLREQLAPDHFKIGVVKISSPTDNPPTEHPNQ